MLIISLLVCLAAAISAGWAAYKVNGIYLFGALAGLIIGYVAFVLIIVRIASIISLLWPTLLLCTIVGVIIAAIKKGKTIVSITTVVGA